MPITKELKQSVLGIVAKGLRLAPDGTPIAYAGSYQGVLIDIQKMILMAHDLRDSGPREKMDRIVADLAHIGVLIQTCEAQNRPNWREQAVTYAMDLLKICAQDFSIKS